MHIELDREDVAISGSVHREIVDVVHDLVPSLRVEYARDYNIILDTRLNRLMGRRLTLANYKLPPVIGWYELREHCKLVILPTPEWVRDSKQKRYICFRHEITELMKKWWEEYTNLMS